MGEEFTLWAMKPLIYYLIYTSMARGVTSTLQLPSSVQHIDKGYTQGKDPTINLLPAAYYCRDVVNAVTE